MKKVTIAIIICAAVFIFFGALSAWVMSSYDFSQANERGWRIGNFFGWRWNDSVEFGNFETRSIDKTLEAEGIDYSSLSFSSVSSNITVTQGNKISARLYGDYSSRGEIDLVMTQVGNALTFRVDFPNNVGTTRTNLKLEVTIPAEYAGDLKLGTVSGSIHTALENNLSGFNANTTSGNIRCGDITADSIRFNSVSGDVYAGTLKAKSKVSSSTTSGKLEIGMLYGALDANSVSGNVRADMDPSDSCDIRTTSGKVTLGVPQDAKIYIDFSSVSGNFESDIPLTFESSSRNSFKGYTDKSGHRIKVGTVSGGFDLTTNN